MAREFANSALLLVGLIAIVLGCALFQLPGPSLSSEEKYSLPLGVTTELVVHLQNRSVTSLQIRRVDTSCGCVRVVAFPERIGPFARGEIVVTATPLRGQWNERQTVQVVLASGAALVTDFEIAPEPLWISFPAPAPIERAANGDLLIRLNPVYSGLVSGALLDIGEPGPVRLDWDPEASTVRVEAAASQFPDPTVLFLGPDDATPIWAERVALPRE